MTHRHRCHRPERRRAPVPATRPRRRFLLADARPHTGVPRPDTDPHPCLPLPDTRPRGDTDPYRTPVFPDLRSSLTSHGSGIYETGIRPPVSSVRPIAAAGTAAESTPAYDAATDGIDPVLVRLRTVAEEVAGIDLDPCTDAQLDDYLTELRRPLAMLEAARARVMATLEDRAARQVPRGGNTRVARDEQRRKAANSQRIPRTRAKREAEAGRAAQQHDATGAAFAKGDILAEHVRLIAELLAHVAPDMRAEVEDRLLALALVQEPVSFGRKARDLVMRIAPEPTADADQRKESRRQLRVADTADGGLVLSGRLHGTSAEVVRTALDAFRRFDTPNSPRTTEQRNADALVQMCDVALKADEAPTQHGARPHVVVLVNAEELDGGAGTARFGLSGQPVSLQQARRVFSDCLVSRVAFAADGALIEASAGVRTVPAALWRALLARDGGCTWDGCDAPPSWCDVAHGDVPFRANQPLHSGDAALLCRRHHTRFDKGPYRMVIDGRRVTYLRLDDDGRDFGATNPGAHGPPTGTGRQRSVEGSDPSSARTSPTAEHRTVRAEGDGSATPRGSAAPGATGSGEAPSSSGPPTDSRAGNALPPAAPNAPPEAERDPPTEQAVPASPTGAADTPAGDAAVGAADQPSLFSDAE